MSDSDLLNCETEAASDDVWIDIVSDDGGDDNTSSQAECLSTPDIGEHTTSVQAECLPGLDVGEGTPSTQAECLLDSDVGEHTTSMPIECPSAVEIGEHETSTHGGLSALDVSECGTATQRKCLSALSPESISSTELAELNPRITSLIRLQSSCRDVETTELIEAEPDRVSLSPDSVSSAELAELAPPITSPLRYQDAKEKVRI